MILTVEEFRVFHQTDETDLSLEIKLKALEEQIRHYTNNKFLARGFEQDVVIGDGAFAVAGSLMPFKVGDTVYMKNSAYNDGLFTVKSISGNTMTVNEDTVSGDTGVIVKVKYPSDVVMGAVNMLKWDLDRREKIGIVSEQISRHQVTYSDKTSLDESIGYPKALVSFLYPYRRARFGG